MNNFCHPILSCEEASAFEKKILRGDGAEWAAMNRAGRSLGRALLADYNELAPLPGAPALLVLLGKGHNGGDALLAADEICQLCPDAQVSILPIQPVEECRSLTRRVLESLLKRPGAQLISLPRVLSGAFDICLDGLLGMRFTPPVREPARQVIEKVNKHPAIRFRVAVDLPSGLGDQAFLADITYATGIAKTPLFDPAKSSAIGRIRYLDLGFFKDGYDGEHTSAEDILLKCVLNPLRQLRPADCDKRSYGHLFVMCGSRSMPGALLMNVKAALKSGVGLVTAFAPESVAAQFAAIVPEAMWVPWPETPDGGLALEGRHLLHEKLGHADALLMGSGIGREPETIELVRGFVQELQVPTILDADALMPGVIDAISKRVSGSGPVILTPHAGEFQRIARLDTSGYDAGTLRDFCQRQGLITTLKGAITRICDGTKILNATFGGPVLARGGSGDILAGLTGSMLAQCSHDPYTAACRAVAWQGLAAHRLALHAGAQAVCTTDIIEHLGPVLRED